MRKILLVAMLVLFSGIASAVLPQGDLYTAGELTNPAINTTLADTGPLAYETLNGAYTVVQPWCATSASANFRFSVRNVGGSEVAAKSFNFRVLANTTGGPPMQGVSFVVPQSFSVRILNPAAITGTVQCVLMIGVDQIIQL